MSQHFEKGGTILYSIGPVIVENFDIITIGERDKCINEFLKVKLHIYGKHRRFQEFSDRHFYFVALLFGTASCSPAQHIPEE